MKPFRFLLFTALCVAAGLAWPQAAAAVESAWDDVEFAAVRLIGAADAHAGATPERPFAAGMEFELKDDWKIYWRAPGDAGFPPRVDWSASDNLESVSIRWPVPERFSIFGLETLGYKHHVVLPVDVTAQDPARPVRLTGAIEYLACSDICIPVEATVDLTVPPGSGAASGHAQTIARFDARVPDAGTAMGLRVKAIALIQDPSREGAGTLRVLATADPALGTAADVFFEGPPGLAYGTPTVADAGDGTAVLSAPVDGLQYLDAPLVGSNLTALVVDGERASEATLIVAESLPADGPVSATDATLLTILGLAVLGGLILNLMPCVLPVLSIKLMGVVGHGGGERGRVRLHFLASAAGIITAFLILAGGLIALKTAGMAVGWGIQFQHPWFLVAMALIVTVFACNLFGFFEIAAPDPVMAAGAAAAETKGLRGDFLTGMLATVLATPCSAPFLGTAVGFAFAGGIRDILLVFAALGIGLALPYLLVAAVPALVTRLPKPGAWMIKLRVVLGLALLATAVWLLWVLSNIVGPLAAATAALFTLALGLLVWLRGRMGGDFGWAGMAGMVTAALLAFAAPVFAPVAPDASAAESLRWTAFDRSAIADRVAAGEIVFVDVTADWCITCKANKGLVLDRAPVIDALDARGVTTMQADWTQPDAAIADYLASFNRYGIPFNAVYGPAAPDGIALPELLTPDAVLDALNRAGG